MSVQMIFPGAAVTAHTRRGALVAFSQRRLLVSVGVTLDRHRHGQRRDVTRERDDVDAEGCRVAAVALRAYSKSVRALEQLLLEAIEHRVGIRAAQLAEERLLGQDGGLLEGAAD